MWYPEWDAGTETDIRKRKPEKDDRKAVRKSKYNMVPYL